MPDCLFCQIVSGDVPLRKIYEDEKTLAFLDTNPSCHGHTLVTPKKHFRNLLDMNEEYLCAVAKTVQKVAVAVKKATGADAINVNSNNEKAAGQVIFHSHTHVIPRFEGDGVFKGAKHIEYREGEADEVADKIKMEL